MTDYNEKINLKIIKNVLSIKYFDEVSQLYDLMKNAFDNSEYLDYGCKFNNDFNNVCQIWYKRNKYNFTLENILKDSNRFVSMNKVDTHLIVMFMNLLDKLRPKSYKDQIKILFIFVLKHEIFAEYTYEIVILFLNIRLIQLGITPLVIHNYVMRLKSAVIAGIDSIIDEIFTEIYSVNHRLNERKSIMTIHEVITKIKPYKNHLIKEYSCYSMWVYGSVIDCSNNEYSDIDILVEGIIEIEDLMKVTDFLEDVTGQKIDIVSFNNVKNSYFYKRIKDKIVKIY